MRIKLFTLIILFTTNLAYAETDTELVKILMAYDYPALTKQVSMCKSLVPTPEQYVEANPDHFGGITPISPKWPQVVKIADQFVYDSCSWFDIQAEAEYRAKQYLSKFSESEKKELLRLYQSEFGKKILKASSETTLDTQVRWGDLNDAQNKKATRRFLNDMNKLISN